LRELLRSPRTATAGWSEMESAISGVFSVEVLGVRYRLGRFISPHASTS